MDSRVEHHGPAAKDVTVATLGELCAGVGPQLLNVAVAPRGLEIPVARVHLQDLREDLQGDQGAGAVVLVVGASTADPELVAAIRSAAVAGAVAVACRDAGRWSPSAVETAETLGLALLSVPADLAWGELYELLAAAVVVDDLESIVRAVDSEWRELNDLPAVVEALATITGGAVAIEDTHGRVVAFSGTEESDDMRMSSILTHRVPDAWRRQLHKRGVYDRLMAGDEVVHVSFDELQPRRAIAIRLGHTMLGSIWLAGQDAALSSDADEALRRAAPIAALQMMRERLAVGVERRMREAAAAALLRGEDASPRVLTEVGLPLDEGLVVLVVEVLSRGASSPAAVAPRLVDLLTVHLRTYQRPAVATGLDHGFESLTAAPASLPPGPERVYVLTRSAGAEDRALLRRILGEGLEHAARALGVRLQAGIGPEAGPAADLVRARRSAEECLLLAPGGDAVVAFEDVHDRALLADVDRFVDGWHGGASAAFRALADHDAAHGTDYLATLACLLDCFGSAPEVARRMHLHVNSARYRIRRIAEITGVELADGEARLALELTLRASRRQNGTRPDAQPRTEKLEPSLISRSRE